jgi:cytidylate kinase
MSDTGTAEDGFGADRGETTPTDRTVDTNLFITVSGPPGCGATTVCNRLSAVLDCGYVSGGDIFRELADERDMSLSQFIAEAEASEEIDRALDRRLQTIAEKWGTANKAFILESRLAGWLAGNRADLRIWLDAPAEVRVDRTRAREEMEAEMRVREVSEAGRYESYYGIDITDQSFYDLSINTARWDENTVLDILLSAVEGYDAEADEGAFATTDVEV